MKPVTQILRAYIEPDKAKPNRDKAKPKLDEAGFFVREARDMDKIRRLLGSDAWPWFGPH